LRILLVHHGFPPDGVGGSEIYTRALARRLARAHDVTVLHRSTEPARPDHHVLESRADGLRVFSLNNLHRDVAGFESYRDARATAAATRVLEEVQPDIVHVGHLAGLSTGLVFAARDRGMAVAITLHDFWTVCPLGQLLNTRLAVCPGPTPRRCLGCVGGQVAVRSSAAREVGRRIPFAGVAGGLLARAFPAGPARISERLDEMREVLRAADALIAPSRFLRDRMASLGAPDIQVLPNGHEDLALPSRRADPDGRLRVGFVGAAIPSKGVHVLAEAFRLLGDPRVALEIHGPFVPYHGDTGYEARVRAILGSRAGEALRGPFPPEKLGEVLAGLDVLAVPSLWEENAPLTVEEAFLARVPVVVSGHGGLAERVVEGRGGLRFRPGDAADLARVLRRLLDGPDLRDELAAAAPHVPTMDEHVAALEAVYETASRRRSSRCGRVGVVVLDRGRPDATAAAARSALDRDVSPRVLVVENGPGPKSTPPAGVSVLRLDSNRGFGGGMNAGIAELRRLGCDRLLLLNNDATLEPGALRRLAEALEDPGLGAVGPVILREADGRVESQGGRFDPRWGWHRLAGYGARPSAREGRLGVETLSGAVLMLSAAALERVGNLDEDYFFGFEDTEWCVRARRAGLGLAVVLGARARHAGSSTLGPASPERLYYAARNHLRAADRLVPRRAPARWLREWLIVGLNLAHALRQGQVPRLAGVRAVVAGARDFRMRAFGPRRP
jgi:GT2 family glycosyltransferase/glycosyltransferase involved in cell wall biosynthesis